MNIEALRTDIPVLFLYNIDPNWPGDVIAESQLMVNAVAQALANLGHPIQGVPIENDRLDERLAPYGPDDYIVFNWCEELPGVPHSESLTAQILERYGFTFTGGDSRALAIANDKYHVKSLLDSQRIPTPCWKVYSPFSVDGWDRFPAIVKPAYEHSSVGIDYRSVVTCKEGLAECVSRVTQTLQQPVLVEEFIDGREFAVSIIGNGDLHILPIAEVDFYVENKYKRIRTHESKFGGPEQATWEIKFITSTDLPAGQYENLRSTACQAYRITQCRDYARLDIRMRDGVFYILDINHNADISAEAGFSLAAQDVGMSYGQFMSYLVNLAAQRHPVFRVS
jgi:D-alanine-D-alanine ligase